MVAILFPDDQPHPPTPCDVQNQVAKKTANPQASPVVGDGRMIPAAPAFDVAPPSSAAWARVAAPEETKPEGLRSRMPLIPRNVFPISVVGANPYRYAAAGEPPLVNAPVGQDPPAEAGGFAVDPASPMIPLVARRVPGVGPMPYERYGFSLLPGYNGMTTPSASIASEQTAPANTLWAREPPPQLPPQTAGRNNGAYGGPAAAAYIAPVGPATSSLRPGAG